MSIGEHRASTPELEGTTRRVSRGQSTPHLGTTRPMGTEERLQSKALPSGLRLGRQPSAAAQFVRPNLSGVRSMFVSDVHYSADELAGVTGRAQTPVLPWNPEPSGRLSANREQLGVRALRDLGILAQVQSGCDTVVGPGSADMNCAEMNCVHGESRSRGNAI
jgi:hypothetical protein